MAAKIMIERYGDRAEREASNRYDRAETEKTAAFYERVISEIERLAMRPKKNPPYSGWRKGWWKKKRPDEDKLAYKTKTDALNVFLDWNRTIVEDYGGPDMVHSPESFEAINHEFNIRGKRRVDTIAKAVWWAMPSGGPPWYLEDINLELLNQTAPVVYGPSGLAFTLPDVVEVTKLIEQEEARDMEGWEAREDHWPAEEPIDIGWDEDDEDPF